LGCRSFKEALVAALQDLCAQTVTSIEPVYVLSPDDLQFASSGGIPSTSFMTPVQLGQLPLGRGSKDRVRKQMIAANRALQGFVRQVPGLSDTVLLEPKVLAAEQPSLTVAAWTLVSYAQEVGAQLSVVRTNARQGLSRLFLGSFAETLILYSKIPVIVVGPTSKKPNRKHLLFATDFGEHSFIFFKKVTTLAKQMGADISIFHSRSRPVQSMLQSGVYLLGGGWFSLPETPASFSEQKESESILTAWVAYALRHGVKARGRSDGEGKSIAEAILKQARAEKTSLIAMAVQSGALAASLVGTISREVLRSAPCPVLVMRA